MGLFSWLFGTKSGHEKADQDKLLKAIRERQKECAMFGGTFNLSGGVFPSVEKRKEYQAYMRKKMYEKIEERNPEFYKAMQQIGVDGQVLVLDSNSFYLEKESESGGGRSGSSSRGRRSSNNGYKSDHVYNSFSCDSGGSNCD